MTDTYIPVTHVWSSFGHTFLSEGEDSVSCLTCGANYTLVRRDDDETGGDYQNNAGFDPDECSGRTDLTHGEDGNAIELVGCNCNVCSF